MRCAIRDTKIEQITLYYDVMMFYNDDDDDVECFPVCVCGDRLEGIMVMSASLFHTLSLSIFLGV